MSIKKSVYFGPYIKTNATIEKEDKFTGCLNPQCKSEPISSKFCPYCGSETVQIPRIKKYKFDIHNFCDKHFGNCDMFTTSGEHSGDSTFILPNVGRAFIYDNQIELDLLEREIPTIDQIRKMDMWNALLPKMDEMGIEYSIHYGIVNCWW